MQLCFLPHFAASLRGWIERIPLRSWPLLLCVRSLCATRSANLPRAWPPSALAGSNWLQSRQWKKTHYHQNHLLNSSTKIPFLACRQLLEAKWTPSPRRTVGREQDSKGKEAAERYMVYPNGADVVGWSNVKLSRTANIGQEAAVGSVENHADADMLHEADAGQLALRETQVWRFKCVTGVQCVLQALCSLIQRW